MFEVLINIAIDGQEVGILGDGEGGNGEELGRRCRENKGRRRQVRLSLDWRDRGCQSD